MYPIHLGDSADFSAVRELFRRSQFNEHQIVARLGLELLTQVSIDGLPAAAPSAIDSLDLLIRVFVRNITATSAEIEKFIPPEDAAALERLGLLTVLEASSSQWYSPGCLCPVGDVFTISDRWRSPTGEQIVGFDDIVYPAVMPNTRMFLGLLPQTKCESFLDLCSGTGVAGLVAASGRAVHADAFDIAPRSTHFAEFAKRLNGLSNFTALTGDLYEPAAGRTFDRIVAHPPYVPVIESNLIFFGGGDDGEFVTRRIFEQLAQYLRPGGTIHCLAMASDRTDQPLERRVREWLGKDEAEFDVAIVVRSALDPKDFAFSTLVRGKGDTGDARHWKALFERLRITTLLYAMIMVQRKSTSRSTFTVRRQTGIKTSRREHEWLLDWETTAAEGGRKVLLDSRFKPSPDCELNVLNRIGADGWEAAGYNLTIAQPFRMQMQHDAWIAYLMTRCDGTKTGAELLAELKNDGVLRADTTDDAFAGVLRTLVSGGFLLIPGSLLLREQDH